MRRIRRRLARWRRGRGAQVAAVLAAAALAVGGGYGIGFVATRPPPSPTPTPEPTPTATATATATPTPTPTPTATATATPTPTVTPLPSPTPPRSTLPPSTPRPTPILPLAAGRVGVRLFDVGLDAPDAVGSLTRTISFTTDRVGDVSATLSRTTGGTVELCVVPAAPGETPRADVDHDSFCDELTNGSVHGVAPRDRQEWTVTLDATSGAPETDLTITFPSATRAVRLAAFRFEAGRKGYNGFTAQLTTSASGALRIVASWSDADGDSTHDYGVSVVDTDGSTTVYRTAGTDSGMDVRTTLAGRRRFQVRVENRDSSAEAATLGGSLTWP